MESLRTHQEQIRFVQVRHEEAAASWPALTLNLQESSACALPLQAREEFTCSTDFMTPSSMALPSLAITGLPYHDLNDTFTQQDVVLDRLFMDVAAYNTRVMGPTHVENITELACRTAISASPF